MCGILGFIGESTDQNKSRILITELYETMQVRGIDAAGFYCCSTNGNVYYYKQPGPSKDIIKTKHYQDIWEENLDLGIFHCRAASTGVGLPSENENNHPFVSDNYKKAIIHNGLINFKEYQNLKILNSVKTECDSEIILRVLEKDNNIFNNIKYLFDNTKNSYFSIAYAESNYKIKKLILTRNKHRPLFFLDVRKECGQIIFFSTFEIFLSSINTLKSKGFEFDFYKNFYNIKPYEIFCFELNNSVINIKSYFAKETEIISPDSSKKQVKNLQHQSVLDHLCAAKEKLLEIESGIKICIENNSISDKEVDDIIAYLDQINIISDSIKLEFLSQ
jgi:asparagine synthetase B (glutamine-hydrolysing)